MPHFFTSFRFALAGRERPYTRTVAVSPWSLTKSMWILLVAFFAVSILYLIEINIVMTRGYEMQRLEARRRELLETNTMLSLEETAFRSLASLEERLATQQFVKTGKGTYLAQSATTLVER